MAPRFLNKALPRAWRRTGHQGSADANASQTTPAPSVRDKPRPQISTEHHEPLSTTPEVLQPVSPAAQPPCQASTDAATPGRLWTQAYDAIKEDNPKLVGAYETVLHRVLGTDSSPADNRDSKGDKTDAEQTRTNLVRLVEAGMEKTEKEAATKHKIQEGMRIVSSVKEMVGTALKHAPEAAAAWGGVCLLLQVLETPIEEASANRDGMAYVVSRMDWYWNLSDLLLEENQERAAGLRGELEKHVVALYNELLSYQMKSVCSCYRSRAGVFFRDVAKFDNWAGAVQAIKDAEKAVQQDIDTYSTQDVRILLNNIAKLAKSQCTHLQDIRQAIQENTRKQEERRQDDKDKNVSRTCGSRRPVASAHYPSHAKQSCTREQSRVLVLWSRFDEDSPSRYLLRYTGRLFYTCFDTSTSLAETPLDIKDHQMLLTN